MDATSSNPNTRRNPSMGTADAQFLGTPYIIDMQRPYEYPFPSPATESCPDLVLPYTHGHSVAHAHLNIPQTQTQPPQLPHSFPLYTTTSSSGSTSTTSSLGSSPPSATSSLAHRTHTSDPHSPQSGHSSRHYHHELANPYPSVSGVHPPISFRPSTLLRRRSSSLEARQGSSASPLSPVSVPIPPRLLGRDLPAGGLPPGNGKWRKGRRSGSDGEGSPAK
jgi:hypothetical protein